MMKEVLKKYVTYLQAFVDGKTVEYNSQPTYVLPDNWVSIPKGCCITYLLDIIRENPCRIKPQPKEIRWTMDDVPPVCWIRENAIHDEINLIIAIDSRGVQTQTISIDYDHLIKYKHSTDLKNWKPCRKKEGKSL